MPANYFRQMIENIKINMVTNVLVVTSVVEKQDTSSERAAPVSLDEGASRGLWGQRGRLKPV